MLLKEAIGSLTMKRSSVSLIVGADGGIGRALADHLALAGEQILETTRRDGPLSERRVFLDLAAEDLVAWRPPSQVSVAYLCAAVTSLERCRAEPAHSARVNVQNTLALARTLAAQGAFVVFLSTNLVYDGTAPCHGPDDPVCPRGEYGRQKALAEEQLLELGEQVAVVRLTKVIGPDMPLIRGWSQSLRNGKIIHPFSDMVMAPVPLGFVVRALDRVAALRAHGILQVSGSCDISYAQTAYIGARALGAASELVQPVEAVCSGRVVEPIPAHTTLNIDRLKSALDMSPPDVEWTITTAFTNPLSLAR